MTTIDETSTPTPKPGMDRRRFLAFTGMAAGAGVALVACGGDDSSSSSSDTAADPGSDPSTPPSTTEGGDAGGGGDLAIAAGAAGLEVLAVNTYTAALDAATAGDLGPVPDAVAEFATTAQSQHQEALDAWNGVLSGAGEPEVTMPPAELEATVNEAFGQVTDVIGVAELANMLEMTAAQTYLDAQAVLEMPEARQLAGSIQVVAQQHSAILNFVLGEYPVPDVFQPTDMSVLGN